MDRENNIEFSDLESVKHLGLQLASEAGALISSMRADSALKISNKSANDLVTDADLAAETLIVDGIRATFPDHLILAEERHSELNSKADYEGPLWIIDPIDGTINYAHGLPVVCVSIAFSYRGKVLFGVVEAPFLGETFHAVFGEGAFLHDVPIRVSNTNNLNDSLVAMGFPHARRERAALLTNQMKLMLLKCRDVRRAGSAAIDLCWVACGRMEFYFEDVHAWDIAAGALIVREAGGKTANYQKGEENGLPEDLNAYRFLASNAAVHEKAKNLLIETVKQEDRLI